MNVVFEWAVSSVLGSPNAQAGAIDVIAIRKQDESLSCSPFHVKLGKSSKKGEKGIVKVKVNKQDVELSMKLGPAGEAFFVERSRDFRRDPSGSFPTSPRDAQNNQPFSSPRLAEDNISVPLTADSLGAGDAVSAKDDPITSTSAADLVSEADLEVQVPAPSSPQLSLKRSPGSSSEFTRPRSFSESAVVLSQSQTVHSVSLEGGCDKMEMVTQQAHSSPQGEGDGHHHGISMDHNHEKIMLTGSGSSFSSAPLVPLLQLPSAETAGTSSEQDAKVGIEDEVPVQGAEVEPDVMVAAEESAVSWIWRWGTLPKKTKPKSASDLESLPVTAAAAAAAAAAMPHTTVSPSTGDAPEIDEASTVETRSTGKAAVAKGSGLNVRHRAVSLPVLRQYESSRIGRNKQTQARRQRAGANADPTAPTMAVFTQLVTAIESDIAPGSSLKNAAAFGLSKEGVGEFSSLLAAARVDNSRFHALSLCGQYLSATGSDPECGGKVPQNAAELRQLLVTHLITPHDIVQSESPVPTSAEEQEGGNNDNHTNNPDTTPEGARVETRRNICPSILASPHLVVILDDFMLPMRAAEKLLQKVCATDGDVSVPLTTQDVPSAGAFTINEQQVLDVLAELEKDLDLDLQSESAGPRSGELTRLPEWAGKRISHWGREFESIESNDSALNDASTPASDTPDQAISAATLGSAVMPTSVEESTSMEEEAADRDRIGSTPLGHMSWQQSFSDLVQAYRVHNIHTIHSYLDLNARAHRFGDTYNELSDGDVASYTEKWNRLQSSNSPGPGATSGSFTALLALDTHTIHRLYTSEQDLDKWAVGVGLGLCGGTHTHSACTSRVQSQDAYDEDPFASRGLSLSHENNRPLQDTQAGSKHIHTHHRQDHEDHHQEQEQEHNHLNESADYGVGEGYSFMSHSDGDGGAGAGVSGLLSALGSHNSLPALQEIEVGDVDDEHEIDETNDADEVVKKSAEVNGTGGDRDSQEIGDIAASVLAAVTDKHQSSPIPPEEFAPRRVPSYIQQQSQQQPLEDTNSTTDDADTDNDCLSLQDIDFEDISPEPATGDFYESDTDSYLSLSLEEGESGRHHNNNNSRRHSMKSNNPATNTGDADEANATNKNTLSSNNNNNHTSAQEIQIGRRRIRRYLYRKVLVPSAEQLSSLPLQDGVNEVEFELPGCNSLRSCLYVWPSDCRIIVTDIEGVFTHATARNPMNSTTVWMQFLGGGGALNSRNVANKKNHFDEAIRLFRALHHQGYRILYVAQNSTNTTTSGSNNNALLSSQEYLQGIRTSTGECLPPGPIFKSPDSLIRAFGASRTDVFKAGALKGVKSLFPSSHNPYHACFCIRESDSIPFARFGFPEGRIFLVSEKGEVKSANRTCNFTFPRLTELLHQIFPHVVDSQSSGPSSSTKGGSVKLTEGVQQASASTGATTGSSNSSSGNHRRPTLEVDTTIAVTTNTTSMNITSAVADVISPRQQAVVTPFSPTGAASTNPPHQLYHLSGTFTAPTGVFSPASAGAGPITPSSTLNSVKSPKSIPFSSLTCGTEDTYNDYNFWKIPPQAIEEDDFY